MKIEKVNDHQIRCTLTREDLIKRQLKVSELAYGTEKARELFQEMMSQANTRFGFNSEDVPLMIEAIPINSESIVLVITKSEEPEELDTRFSQFGPSVQEDAAASAGMVQSSEESDEDEVLDLFNKLQEGDFAGFLNGAANHGAQKSRSAGRTAKHTPAGSTSITCFRLDAMHDVLQLSSVIPTDYKGRNTLFRDPDSGAYLLAIYGDPSDRNYKNICRLLGEYAQPIEDYSRSSDYLEEHYPVIIAESALQKISRTI